MRPILLLVTTALLALINLNAATVRFGSGNIQSVPAESIVCGAEGRVVFVTSKQAIFSGARTLGGPSWN